MMLDSNGIYSAVRRGYRDLENASPSDIQAYFDGLDEEAFAGHVSNIKGILFEQEVTDALNAQGLEAQMFEATNHPISDLAIFEDGELVGEIQLKATDSTSYIQSTLDSYDDVPIVATSEVAEHFDTPFVIDSGIENSDLEVAVEATLGAELPDEAIEEVGSSLVDEGLDELISDAISPIPISPIGLIAGLLGLPFLF